MHPDRPLRITWVATPPPGVPSRPVTRRRRRYLGPPAYPAPPRWGFPQLTWRWPTSLTGAAAAGAALPDRVRAAAGSARALLIVTAATALLAAGAEIWRYVLLVQSRSKLLPSATVGVSDTLTDTAGVLAVVFGLAAAVMVLVWLHRARRAGAESAGYGPARPDWQVLAGLLIPGVNLVVPFSVAAELEHAALGRDPGSRPVPSRLLWRWWAAWVVGGLLWLATLLANQRDSVQAMADGVLLHAVLDVSAVVVAVLTGQLVRWLTLLLVPVRPVARGHHVVRVEGAPDPAPRRDRPVGAPR